METKFYVIGLSDSRQQWLPPQVTHLIAGAHVFSGGRRHKEIVQHLLPADALWIDITLPLETAFSRYEEAGTEIVVFASGDPLFYGFAATLKRRFPEAEMHVYPSFNSLQMLAHSMQLPYHDMHCVSLTGRPWNRLDEALIMGMPLIGCLTDHKKTPHAIWQRMQDYGYTNYEMTVGECLGNELREHVAPYEPDRDYASPNCVMLRRLSERQRPFGIPEHDFDLLNGRSRMITKMPIRLLTLSMLDLRLRNSLWDVGFCTGSVSIEAKLQFPSLDITAFEIRPECEELMAVNSRRWGALGITAVMGDFLSADLSQYPAPDAVFVGGHGGKLAAMLDCLSCVMRPGATLVFNSVSEESATLFSQSLSRSGFSLQAQTTIAIDNYNPIRIMKAVKE